jgi:hypothetical protein
VVFTVIQRKELGNVVAIIKRFDPRTFYAVNDLQSAVEGIFPASRTGSPRAVADLLRRVLPIPRVGCLTPGGPQLGSARTDAAPVRPGISSHFSDEEAPPRAVQGVVPVGAGE